MTRAHRYLPDAIVAYLDGVAQPEHPALRGLREATAARLGDLADMQSGPAQAGLMGLLVRLMGARRVLEIGTFTGYGSLALALALPPDGEVVALDVNADFAAIGQPFWRSAGVEEKIRLRIGPATESLDHLIADGEAGWFDYAFVDADKKSYEAYYERALVLVRTGGLIVLDNMLWHGSAADPDATDKQSVVLRRLASAIRDDRRVEATFLPIADGVVLARKRSG
ncbi:class I SAM-dependent methyltransferase [Marinivivus vitaminiproducens]|uniref:class I SAM-dependent methyltransferase n=1 Tax=Marinivivus vitaminiproducens TaxID=3035935 RepID=UPI003F9EE68F